VLFDKSPGHINNKKIAEGLLGSSVFVEVFTEGESGTLVESFNLTVDCDGIQTISCANRSNPVITVTTPENGSSYDAYLYEGDVTIDFSDLPDGFVDSALGIDDGTSVDLLPGGNGIFTVALDGNGGNDSSFTVDVDCPRKKRSTTPTTAPVLPSTGSDSNTLLVIAPMMVLLGGALIVARRRLVNA
jgi:LPXTG-motif cell wall-anchored protein